MSDSVDVKVAKMEVEIEALKQRVQGAEERLKDLTDIMMTIQHLSESVKQIADSVASMNTRVTAIEQVPAEKWNTMTKQIIAAILGVIGGAIGSGLLSFLTHLT